MYFFGIERNMFIIFVKYNKNILNFSVVVDYFKNEGFFFFNN